MKTILEAIADDETKDEVVTPEVDSLLATHSSDEKRFIKKHKIKKLADRVGNDSKVYNGSDEKVFDRKANRYGYAPGEDEAVYEAAEPGSNAGDHPAAVDERTAIERAGKTSLHAVKDTDDHVGYAKVPHDELGKQLEQRGWQFDDNHRGGKMYTKIANGVFHQAVIKPINDDSSHIEVSHSHSVHQEGLHIYSQPKIGNKSGAAIKKFMARLKDGSTKAVYASDESQAAKIAGKGVSQLTTVREENEATIGAVFESLTDENQTVFLEKINNDETRDSILEFVKNQTETV
jgi:hypothetical protein